VPVFPRKTQLSALITVASLMIGAAWIVTRALFIEARGGVRGVSRPMPKPAPLRAEPTLPAQREPLLVEMTESDDDAPSAAPPQQHRPVLIGSGDIAALMARIEDRRPAHGGHRTLLTGESEAIDPSREAFELVKGIADTGAQVILVDWSTDGDGSADALGIDASIGLNDLMRGDASFEEIIQRIEGSNAHAIASGKSLDAAGESVDGDQLNLVLDALDEAYDYIIVAGRHNEARKLFEKIEGRFDAGVTITEPHRQSRALEDPFGTFLGFEVADIDIIRFERRDGEAAPLNQRITRATQAKSVQIARQA
jgi:Mrp family chromosome partitioning ATPase